MWFLPRSRVFWLLVGIIVGATLRGSPMGFVALRVLVVYGLLLWLVVMVGLNGRRVARNLIESALYAPACPSCGRHALARKAVVSFGDRYYECGECSSRWKRKPFSLWEPAVGKNDAAVYAPVHRSPFDDDERWNEKETDNGWQSIDNLVRKHRQRQDAN